MDDLASQPEEPAVGEELMRDESLPTSRRLMRGFGLLLVIIAVLLGVYGTVAYTAWQRGQTLRVENAQLALEEQILDQINLAQGDISNGNFALAIRRLEWVLERDPESVEALSLHDEAQSGLSDRLTPTPRPTATATPEAAETPNAAAQPDEALVNDAFNDLRSLMEDEEWADAISAVAAFQQDHPNERRQQTDEMLYNAYMNLGIQLISGTQIELGLFYLNQAERLGDLPLEVQDQRTWAELYLQGIGYYAVNWETTIFYFRGLCAAAPFYQDACQKLFNAYDAFGDQYAANQDWCPAEEWYGEAVRLENVSAVVDKRREAAANCLEATPTPEATITGTVPITNTIPNSDTVPSVPPEETSAP